MFKEIIPFIESNSQYLCVTEFFVKIWNDSKSPYIENKLSIQKVKEKIKEFKTFNEFDKNSHWHGNHISDNDGRIKSYLNYFSEDDIKYLKFIYKEFREEYILDK